MDIIIEPGACEDTDGLEQLYDELTGCLEKGVNYPGWLRGIYPTREDAVEGIRNHSLYVAKYNGKIIGSMVLNHCPENGYEGAGWQYDGDYETIYVIHTLAVHPSFFKLGIGRQLMDFAESLGRKNKMKAIRLDVYENNTPAVKLYESCGYRYTATIDLGLGAHGLDWFKLYEKLL